MGTPNLQLVLSEKSHRVMWSLILLNWCFPTKTFIALCKSISDAQMHYPSCVMLLRQELSSKDGKVYKTVVSCSFSIKPSPIFAKSIKAFLSPGGFYQSPWTTVFGILAPKHIQFLQFLGSPEFIKPQNTNRPMTKLLVQEATTSSVENQITNLTHKQKVILEPRSRALPCFHNWREQA